MGVAGGLRVTPIPSRAFTSARAWATGTTAEKQSAGPAIGCDVQRVVGREEAHRPSPYSRPRANINSSCDCLLGRCGQSTPPAGSQLQVTTALTAGPDAALHLPPISVSGASNRSCPCRAKQPLSVPLQAVPPGSMQAPRPATIISRRWWMQPVTQVSYDDGMQK